MRRFLICLRGSVCLYQGEEWACPRRSWRSRTCKTPMASSSGPSSRARRLPHTDGLAGRQPDGRIHDRPEKLAAGARRASRPRSRPAGGRSGLDAGALPARAGPAPQPSGAARGRDVGLRAQGDVVSFQREDARETVFCAVNLGETAATIQAPAGNWRTIGDDLGGADASGTSITLGAWQVCLAIRPDREGERPWPICF